MYLQVSTNLALIFMSILPSFNSKWWLRVFCYISYIREADFWVSPERLSCSGTRMMFAPQPLLTKLMHFSLIQLTVWLQPSALTHARTCAQARTQNTSVPLQGIPPARSSNFNFWMRTVSLWMSYSRNHISEFFSYSFSIARCLSIRRQEFIIKTFYNSFHEAFPHQTHLEISKRFKSEKYFTPHNFSTWCWNEINSQSGGWGCGSAYLCERLFIGEMIVAATTTEKPAKRQAHRGNPGIRAYNRRAPSAQSFYLPEGGATRVGRTERAGGMVTWVGVTPPCPPNHLKKKRKKFAPIL